MGNKFVCAYPGCKKAGVFKQAFKLINEGNALVELLFCPYHHLIVMGGHFEAKVHKIRTAEIDSKLKTEFELIGPLLEVEVAEQVIAAREMIAKLKSDNK